MRALALLVLAGCPAPTGSQCTTDGECGGDLVCARDGTCEPLSDVVRVTTRWTIGGMEASPTTCAPDPDFFISFLTVERDSFGFAPVPCVQGQFFVDRLPKRYVEVELGVEQGFHKFAVIDATGTATFDLTL